MLIFERITNPDKTDFTVNQGKLIANYDDIVAVFGEPERIVSDKSQVSWDIEFEDGVIATIYDWKETARPQNITEWMIGGHVKSAVDHVFTAMKKV